MAVKLLLNLGTRHPLVQPVDTSKHREGTVHEFDAHIEEGLIRMNHAELAAPKPKPITRKRKPKTEETPTEES